MRNNDWNNLDFCDRCAVLAMIIIFINGFMGLIFSLPEIMRIISTWVHFFAVGLFFYGMYIRLMNIKREIQDNKKRKK